jgi:epoxyqueuosine reductase
MGKNGNIINRSIGSWFFIATVVTNQMFESDSLYKPSCGNCTTCLDACPTKAIVVPYVIDSNLCISYQTIESKQDIPEFLMGKFDNWIFGCDICQEVCPWNVKFQKQTKIRDFIPHKNADHLNLESIQSMTKEKFSELFGSSSVKRTKLSGLKRNADFVSKEI